MKKNHLFKSIHLSGESTKNILAMINGVEINQNNFMTKIIICTDYPKVVSKLIEKKFFFIKVHSGAYVLKSTLMKKPGEITMESMEVEIIKGDIKDSYKNFMTYKDDGLFYDLLKEEFDLFEEGTMEEIETFNKLSKKEMLEYRTKLKRPVLTKYNKKMKMNYQRDYLERVNYYLDGKTPEMINIMKTDIYLGRPSASLALKLIKRSIEILLINLLGGKDNYEIQRKLASIGRK